VDLCRLISASSFLNCGSFSTQVKSDNLKPIFLLVSSGTLGRRRSRAAIALEQDWMGPCGEHRAGSASAVLGWRSSSLKQDRMALSDETSPEIEVSGRILHDAYEMIADADDTVG